MPLPIDIDTSYPDDAAQPGRKLHQQHHDTIHAFVNDLDAATPLGTAGKVLRSDGSAVSWGYGAPSIARIRRSSIQTIQHQTNTAIDFNAEDLVATGAWAVGQPSRLVLGAVAIGRWLVIGHNYWAPDADGARTQAIYKNGSALPGSIQLPSTPSANSFGGQIVDVVTIDNASDYLQLVVWHSAGAALDLAVGVGTEAALLTAVYLGANS